MKLSQSVVKGLENKARFKGYAEMTELGQFV